MAGSSSAVTSRPNGTLGASWAEAGEERADYIDVFQDPDTEANVLGKDHLSANSTWSIATWLEKQHAFSEAKGGLRMIILDRHRYDVEFPVTEETFKTLSNELHLSKRTRASFDCDAGTFSRAFCFDKDDKITGLDIIMKFPQKREFRNCGLSMHFEFSTKVTTALLFGTDVIVCREEPNNPPDLEDEIEGHPNLSLPQDLEGDDEKVEQQRKKWLFDNIHRRTGDESKHHYQRAWPELADMINANKDKLNHPLALPCILLDIHLNSVQEFSEHGLVAEESWKIMNQLGMRGDDQQKHDIFWVKAMGVRNAYTEEGVTDRINAKKLTARLDRQVLRILFTLRGPEWNQACSEFMLDLAKGINSKISKGAVSMPSSPSIPAPGAIFPAGGTSVLAPLGGSLHEELKAGLEYNIQMCQSLTSRLTIMKANMTLQLDVCASITGQASNEFSARIAWDTSRDSTSMKILAVITAFFLPGTFVATFMSMGIWNWQWSGSADNHQNPGVVSPYWTIYLKAAIPLTVATLLGWLFWWIYETVERENNYIKTSSGDLGGSSLEKLVRKGLKWRKKRKDNKVSKKEESQGRPSVTRAKSSQTWQVTSDKGLRTNGALRRKADDSQV